MLQMYCKEIILDHVNLFRDAVRLDFLFMDNACAHRSTEVSNNLENEDMIICSAHRTLYT